MRAMVYRSYCGPEKLEPMELDTPTPKMGALSIRVRAASVNPVDWKKASGMLRLIQPASFPIVPGYDVAGEVMGLGPGVSGFSIGDRVHARIKESKGGACAEIAVAGVDVTCPIPTGMGFAEAAALPLAGMTALQGLRDGGKLGSGKLGTNDPGKRVLVVGASGGVGHIAVQVARAWGAHVVGVCSSRNVALVRELGAHEVIDYTKDDAFAGQAPFDIILDCVGGPMGTWLAMLTPKGHYASCLPGPAVIARSALNLACARQVTAVILRPRAADLALLDGLFESGKLRVVIDSRFPLEKLADAWTRSITGRAAGKVVIEV